mmetsp:Transcript_106238/g.310573  ORF Transcript_106238/g.310573 Transcript_106238/m.310573 type:complete len:217 (+) Transcript_106238:1538-2188(+)
MVHDLEHWICLVEHWGVVEVGVNSNPNGVERYHRKRRVLKAGVPRDSLAVAVRVVQVTHVVLSLLDGFPCVLLHLRRVRKDLASPLYLLPRLPGVHDFINILLGACETLPTSQQPPRRWSCACFRVFLSCLPFLELDALGAPGPAPQPEAGVLPGVDRAQRRRDLAGVGAGLRAPPLRLLGESVLKEAHNLPRGAALRRAAPRKAAGRWRGQSRLG